MSLQQRILRSLITPVAFVIFCGLLVFFGLNVLVLISRDSYEDSSDTAYSNAILERAMEKVDRGRVSSLTADEADALRIRNEEKREANRIAVERRAEKAQEKFSENEMKIYNYMKNRWTAISESPSGYVPELHDDMVANEASARFGVTAEYAGEIYVKIDMASYGLSF